MPKIKKTEAKKPAKRRGRPPKAVAATKAKTKTVKTVKKATKKPRRLSEKRIAALIEQRKSSATIPLLEYEYNLRIGLFFGVLLGVIITTYLWVLVNFIGL